MQIVIALLLAGLQDDTPQLILKIDDSDAAARKDAFEKLAGRPEARERLKKAVASEGNVWLKKAVAERSRALKAAFAASRKGVQPAALEAKRKELLDLLAAGDTKSMEPKVKALWTEFYLNPKDVEKDEKFAAAHARVEEIAAWQARLEVADGVKGRAAEAYRALDEATLLQGVPPKDQKIMAENAALAGKVKDPELSHARTVNYYRLLLGKGALKLDAKLCDAAREHCDDMIKHDFFDHMSPLPGKRTPGDRARKHGTSAGGENIHMGSDKPEGAFWSWFNSLGHHRNMVRDYSTFGVGNAAKHWTQMFD